MECERIHPVKSEAEAMVHTIVSYTLARCPETADLILFYRWRSSQEMTNRDILSELSWIVYSSGFRFDVVKKYWPAIREAFYRFDVKKVASLSKNQENQARRICLRSGFRNLRKAKWCIQNAQRIIELDYEKKHIGGLKGFFAEISKRPLFELVKLAPNLKDELKFKGIGDTTVFHLMKNVGMDIFKPDIHVRRVLFNIGLINGEEASASEICNVMSLLSSACKMRVSELDTIFFVYGRATGDRIETALSHADKS